jgi:hypothetical protein
VHACIVRITSAKGANKEEGPGKTFIGQVDVSGHICLESRTVQEREVNVDVGEIQRNEVYRQIFWRKGVLARGREIFPLSG